ncbi:uncharacterized protein BX664DRAFT_339928 [Halteromyces radiatus]|uniref:uncharacterized protein n=1 Tax=Halteromyces radiatus TaxID=101107 RepID=UPI00221FE94C|nr:uncharacterized protein BX664DRAFT_339928 [Halteromyces radiatus]KAI8083153.1 hypothetical protein BX664DRAFT_339928 [Halteromyces radiatus]
MPSNSHSHNNRTTATSVLVIGMLISGVCNTILNKYQDMQCVENCQALDPAERRYYEQPVWQTLNMFVGEAFVWTVYFYQKWQKRRSNMTTYSSLTEYPPSSVQQMDASAIIDDVVDHSAKDHPSNLPSLHGIKALLFWIPTLCDLTATTLMNVGLILTSASVYQMLRGAVVIFTGIFSYLFLHRRLRLFEWFSLVCVVLGVAIVGLSSVLFPQTRPGVEDGMSTDVDYLSFVGVLMVLGAQIFTATQFVVEEKILAHYKVTPLKAVGLEGSFGVISVVSALPILHVLFSKQSSHFDMYRGFHDFFDHPGVWQTGIFISLSIAFFNWFGLSITNNISATARSTIDTSRTLFIWMVSIYLGWEIFSWIQVIGFIIMVTGTFYFNGVLRWPFAQDELEEGETDRLLPSPE